MKQIKESDTAWRTSGKAAKHLKNFLLCTFILALSFGVSVIVEKVMAADDHIATVFVFGVFLVSLVTDGYFYGIAAAFISVFAVNFAFTFPYFHFNFTIPENLISALIMITISLMTSALTTRLKKWQKIKADGEREMMRANLLRAVSHDLRTPLTTIYGSSSAILDSYDSLSEESKKKMVCGIKEDSEWLIRMVENLLSVTKIDSGSVELIKTPTVLEELIDSVLLKFKKRHSSQAVSVNIPDELVLIPMDAILIEQVISNILENAIEHAVGMTELSMTVSVRSGQAVFEIADDGCGIEADRLEKIFMGYYDSKEQSSNKGKRNFGIGLSVCATIIKAHGGWIKAECDGGAKFIFALNTEDGYDQ